MSQRALVPALAALVAMACPAVAVAGSGTEAMAGRVMRADMTAVDYMALPDLGTVQTTPWIASHVHQGLDCSIVLVPDDPTQAPQVLVEAPSIRTCWGH